MLIIFFTIPFWVIIAVAVIAAACGWAVASWLAANIVWISVVLWGLVILGICKLSQPGHKLWAVSAGAPFAASYAGFVRFLLGVIAKDDWAAIFLGIPMVGVILFLVADGLFLLSSHMEENAQAKAEHGQAPNLLNCTIVSFILALIWAPIALWLGSLF